MDGSRIELELMLDHIVESKLSIISQRVLVSTLVNGRA